MPSIQYVIEHAIVPFYPPCFILVAWRPWVLKDCMIGEEYLKHWSAEPMISTGVRWCAMVVKPLCLEVSSDFVCRSLRRKYHFAISCPSAYHIQYLMFRTAYEYIYIVRLQFVIKWLVDMCSGNIFAVHGSSDGSTNWALCLKCLACLFNFCPVELHGIHKRLHLRSVSVPKCVCLLSHSYLHMRAIVRRERVCLRRRMCDYLES